MRKLYYSIVLSLSLFTVFLGRYLIALETKNFIGTCSIEAYQPCAGFMYELLSFLNVYIYVVPITMISATLFVASLIRFITNRKPSIRNYNLGFALENHLKFMLNYREA
jgi:hypothetical protein